MKKDGKILLVTADLDCLTQVSSALSDYNYQITHVMGVDEPINLLKDPSNQFDTVLVDQRLILMDGIGFIIYLRKVLKLKNLPIILLLDDYNRDVLTDLSEMGMVEFIKKPVNGDELAARIRYTQYIFENIYEISLLADYDELTGLYSRRTFFNFLKIRQSEAKRYQTSFSLCMMDLDNFKSINDRFGHTAGDIVLSSVGQTVKSNLRISDIGGRYGGEEIILMLSETCKNGAKIAANRIRKKVAGLNFEFLAPENITISGGIAEYDPANHKTYEDLIVDADKALYEAKRLGKNRIVCFGSLEKKK